MQNLVAIRRRETEKFGVFCPSIYVCLGLRLRVGCARDGWTAASKFSQTALSGRMAAVGSEGIYLTADNLHH